jgi:hypothetical protein
MHAWADVLCAGTRVKMKLDGWLAGSAIAFEWQAWRDGTYPLSYYIADGPGENDVVILVAVEVQVLLHARNELR